MNHFSFIRRISLARRIAPATIAALLFSVPALAGPVFNIAAGSLTASRLLNLNTQLSIYDVRGNVTLGVTNGAPLGFVILTDSTDGTDPNFATLAFGNAQLFGFAPGPQESATNFNFAAPALTSTTLTLSADGAAVSPNPVTNPALSGLIGPMQFSFILTNVGTPDANNQVLVTYSLTGATAASAVPEPGGTWLLAAGLGALVVFRRIRRTVSA